MRLSGPVQSDQSMQSMVLCGGGDHMDSCFGATFMKLDSDSVVESSPKTYLEVRRRRAVTGREVATSASADGRRNPFLFLRFLYGPFRQALYR